jgi:hypothetical protein
MSKKKSPKPRRGRVTHLEVSKLYNLGNYSNVSYRICVEVPRGASAKIAFVDAVSILHALRPVPKPHCIDQFEACLKKTNEERSTWERDHFDEWSTAVQEYKGIMAMRRAAIDRLDLLGGTMVERDAKTTWDDTPF